MTASSGRPAPAGGRSAPGGASRRAGDRGYRHRAITLMLAVLALDYADRNLVGALGPTLKTVYGISNTGLGLLSGAFSVVGALATLPIGKLADRVNRTLLLAGAIVIWSVAMGVTGAAVSLAMLVVARLFLGAVAATTGPAIPSLTGDLVPAGDRASTLGKIASGQVIGIGVGYLLAAVVTAYLSFRWGFWLLGFGGAFLALGFWRLPEPARTGAAGAQPPGAGGDVDEYQDGSSPPEDGTAGGHSNGTVSPSPGGLLVKDPTQMSLWEVTRYVVRVRTDVIVLVSRSVGDYFLAGVSTFAVIYITGAFGVSTSEADLSVLALGVGAIAGVLLAGRAGDALLARGRRNARLWLAAVAYPLAAAALIPTFLVHSIVLALVLATVAAGFLSGASPLLDAVRLDVVVPALRGRAEAIRQILRTAAEGGSPAAFGALSGVLAGGGTAGLREAFLFTVPLLIVDGLVLLFALRTYQPDKSAADLSAARFQPDSRG